MDTMKTSFGPRPAAALLAAILWAGGLPGRAGEAELAEVKAGVRKVANASWWGFNPEDATQALQDAVNSGVEKLIVDAAGSDWVVGPIVLRSGLELVFAQDVVVRGLPGAFKGKSDCLFTARNARNIVMRGEKGSVLKMNKADFQNSDLYEKSAWRHAVSLRGCENVTLSGLTLDGSGGDGIYVAGGGEASFSRDVLIEDLVAVNHHRLGIAVISAENLVIRNSKFNNVSGSAPNGGIDFEPNRAGERLVNCLVENSEFNGNAVAGAVAHLSGLTAESEPVSITFRNCAFSGNPIGVRAMASAGHLTPVKGSITFENCSVEKAKASLTLINPRENGLTFRLKDCDIDNTGAEGPAINLVSQSTDNVANVIFENVVAAPGGRPALAFQGMTGVGVKSLEGDLKVRDAEGRVRNFDMGKFLAANQPDPELAKFEVAKVVLSDLRPLGSQGGDGSSPNAWFRKELRLLQYAEAGKPLDLRFKARRVGKLPLKVIINVSDDIGTALDRFVVADREEFTYTLKPGKTGVHVMEFAIEGGHAVAIASGHPGQAVLADSRVRMIYAGGTEFFFLAPAGVKDIAVEVLPDAKEPVAGALIDPDGRTAAAFERTDTPQMLSHRRADASRDEVWRLRFSYVKEDFSFRLGAPLPPLVAVAAGNLLVKKD